MKFEPKFTDTGDGKVQVEIPFPIDTDGDGQKSMEIYVGVRADKKEVASELLKKVKLPDFLKPLLDKVLG